MNDGHRLTTKSIFGDTDAERKTCPIFDGSIMYFPRALAAIARHSQRANEKHNPGEPLHWARGKSTDHLNTAVRHLIDAAMGILWDGEYNNMVAGGWRVLAALETYLELVEGIDAVSAARRDMAIAAQAKPTTLREITAAGQSAQSSVGACYREGDFGLVVPAFTKDRAQLRKAIGASDEASGTLGLGCSRTRADEVNTAIDNATR